MSNKSGPDGPTLLSVLVTGVRAEIVRVGGCPLDAFTWQQLLGDRIAARSSPDSIRDGVLTIKVVSSVWAQELSLLSTTIIARLAKAGIAVKSIRCRVAAQEFHSRAPSPHRSPKPPPVPPQTPELPSDLDEELARISDKDLRELIETTARAQLGQRAVAAMRKRPGPTSATTPNVRAPRSAGRGTAQQDQNAPGPSAKQQRTPGRR